MQSMTNAEHTKASRIYLTEMLREIPMRSHDAERVTSAIHAFIRYAVLSELEKHGVGPGSDTP